MNKDYHFEPLNVDENTIRSLISLFKSAFGENNTLTTEFIKWQYERNPDGNAIGYNAFCGDQLAAHYVLLPIQALVLGRKTKGLLSVNTATHPDHQKQGLFVKLAELSFETALMKGYEFVIGVANQHSVHGFVEKLGFQNVCQLDRRFILSPIAINQHTPVSFSRYWDKANIAWRLANPSQLYSLQKLKKYTQIIGRSTRFSALVGQVATSDVELNQITGTTWPQIHQWIGVDPSIDWHRTISFSVPARLRPIPLHLIYRNLVNKMDICPTDVRFWIMDFDAY